MKKKIKFFNLVKYEFIRIMRNKLILFLLLGFSCVFLFIVSTSDFNNNSYPVALYKGEVENSKVEDFITVNIPQDNIVIVNSVDEGKNLVKTNEVKLFIFLTDEEPINAVIYYDSANIISSQVVGNIKHRQNKYMYNSLLEFIEDYGIKINEKYFNLVSYETVGNQKVSYWQAPFSLQIGACISVVLMFGIAYSITRDNETNVSKNLRYLPIGENKYLFSKFVPYFSLGLLEVVFVYIFGIVMFKIEYSVNIFILFLIALIFVVATINMAFIFSMLKSQIATAILSTFVILLPAFALSVAYIESYPIIFQFLLYCMPILPFCLLNNALMFNGTFLVVPFVILLVQSAVYYMIALILLRHKAKTQNRQNC